MSSRSKFHAYVKLCAQGKKDILAVSSIVDIPRSPPQAKAHRSISSILEDLIRQQQQAKEVEGISASFTQYYDSLTAEDIAEDRACGDFAATQFPSED
jgi:hypothetical protein